MATKINNNITANQFDQFSSPFALDLIAAFSLAEEEIIKLINKAGKENWTMQELFLEIERKLL